MLFHNTDFAGVITSAKGKSAVADLSLCHALRLARQGAPLDEPEGVYRRHRLQDLDGRL